MRELIRKEAMHLDRNEAIEPSDNGTIIPYDNEAMASTSSDTMGQGENEAMPPSGNDTMVPSEIKARNIVHAAKIRPILKEWLLASAVFVVWLAIFFYPAIFQGKLIYTADTLGSDLTDFNIPRRYLVTQAIKDGEFPQWEPQIGCGATVAAEGHPGLFYPFSTPLNLFLPITAAANASVFCAMYIAFLGTYWLIRLHGAKPAPALLGAMAFAWGGTLIFRLRHLNIIHVIAWMPVSFALLRLYLSSGRRVWWIGLVLTWSLQLLAGHPQFAYISQMSYWAYIMAWIAFSPRAPRRRFRVLGTLILAGATALMLGAAQWLPTLELSQLTPRNEISTAESDLNSQSYQLANLSCILNPYHLGNPACPDSKYPAYMSESRPYWGTLGLLLALVAWGKRTRRQAFVWATMSCIFFWLALGPQGDLYKPVCHILPGLALFRYPCRFLVPLGLAVAILGALGANNVYTWLHSTNPRRATAVMTVLLVITTGELGYTSTQFQGYLPANWCQPPAILQAIGPNCHRIYAPFTFKHYDIILHCQGWRHHEGLLMQLYNELPVDTSTIWGASMATDQACLAGGLSLNEHNMLQWHLLFSIVKNKTSPYHISRPVLAALRQAGVSHIVSLESLFTPQDSGITDAPFQIPGALVHIYKLDNTLPEARLVPNLIPTLPKIYQDFPDPVPPQLLKGLFEPDPEQPKNIGQCTAHAPTRNTYSVTTDCSQDSYLVLARSYHPNWRVRLDGGVEQPLLLVNFAFQAVKVPAGRHKLEFRYNSPAQDLGLILSSVALAVLVIVGAWGVKRTRTAIGSAA